MTRDHRRLAAIVSADVVGYSLLMGRDDSATLAGLKAYRQAPRFLTRLQAAASELERVLGA